MATKNCSWNAIDLLNLVDGAELVTVERDIYLCIWLGGREVEIYDLTKPICIPEIEPLAWNTEPTPQSAQQAIDEYFIQLDVDFEDSCLTTPLLGVIVEGESNSTLPEDN